MSKFLVVYFLAFGVFFAPPLSAQIIERFDDGDFTNNPSWIGDPNNWTVVGNELRSNNTTAGGIFYLSTASYFAVTAQWELDVRLAFSTSGANYVDVYLTAGASDLTDNNNTGYFVRVGGTSDEISLFRRDAGGATFKLIDGIDGVVNSSTNNSIRLKVTRTPANTWSLTRNINGRGTVTEGTATDATYTTSSFFGFLVIQGTSSTFFQKHFFDNIEIRDYVPDITPPAIEAVSLISGTAVDILFNEPIDSTTAQIAANYSVDNGIGSPTSATIDATNPALVHLVFGATFPNGPVNTITVTGVTDISGNAISNGTGTFTYVVDVTAPSILSVTATSSTTLDVLFSEPLDAASANTTANYAVTGIGTPANAQLDIANPTIVHLSFSANFPSSNNNTIVVTNIADVAGNILATATGTFSFYIPGRFDVIIDEIFADPTPVVQLPDAEFIEIKNLSGREINLQGWTLSSSTSTSSQFPSYVLPADSFLILTNTSNMAGYTPFGRVLGVPSFPALTNSGTTLTLTSREGVIIHTLSWNTSWYQNGIKSAGGWTLEMIDTKNPCIGAINWKASVDPRGGTPGSKNSVDGNNPDTQAPELTNAAVLNNQTVLLTFSESLDVTKAGATGNYSVSNGINTPVSAVPVAPDFTKVQLTFSSVLATGTVYTIKINNVADCSGNTISALNTARIGVPEQIQNFDIVINEILFNPKPNSTDYVEIYNRSNKIFDLKNLYLSNRSDTILVTGDNKLFFPGDYYVISESSNVVKQNYVARNPVNFIDVSSLPSMSDDKGSVVLINNLGEAVDNLQYDAQWHFGLLDNEDGISLERIDYNKPTQDASNWHSAASTVGFGTPTYQNSQYRSDITGTGEMSITPKTFSPDNDGFEDYTTINYSVDEVGYLANITIFDATGRAVRFLAKNATLGLKGTFRWDGLNDKMTKVPVGAYVVYAEFFNLNGKKKTFKKAAIVASRF
jgi:hypothetical protein